MDAGAERVLVLDHTLQRAEVCLERSGILNACKPIRGVHVMALQERKFFREIPVPQGKAFERVEVMKEVLEAHVLINLPVAKSHSATGVSLGIKRSHGTNLGPGEFPLAIQHESALADLLTVIKPQLTILDATRALISGGPGGPGEVKN